jgi:hypothetical protein
MHKLITLQHNIEWNEHGSEKPFPFLNFQNYITYLLFIFCVSRDTVQKRQDRWEEQVP